MITTRRTGGRRVGNQNWPGSTASLGLAIALALITASCSTDREVTEPEPVPVTAALLETNVLTAADLPAGWAAAAGAAPTIAADLISDHDCDEPVTTLEPDEAAGAALTRSGAEMTSTVAWFPGQGGAAEQAYRDMAEDCRAVVLADRGLSMRTSGLDFGVLSDDVLAIRIEIEPTNGPITERDVIVLRRGDLLHVIRLSGPRPSDKALLDSVVRTSLGRIGLLHEDTT